MFNVGSQLRKTRKKSALTLDQLAASSGVDRGTISRIELGHVSPRIDTIGFLCEAMNTSLSVFFSEASAELPAGDSPLAVLGAPLAGILQEPNLAVAGKLKDLPEPIRGLVKAKVDGFWPVPPSFWKGLLEVIERFEILVRNSHEMILVTDPAGQILYASPRTEHLLGYRSPELVGLALQSLLHPADLAHYENAVYSVAAASRNTQSLEPRMRHKDGTWRPIFCNLTNQLHNPCVQAFVINAMDLRQLQAGSEALEEAMGEA